MSEQVWLDPRCPVHQEDAAERQPDAECTCPANEEEYKEQRLQRFLHESPQLAELNDGQRAHVEGVLRRMYEIDELIGGAFFDEIEEHRIAISFRLGMDYINGIVTAGFSVMTMDDVAAIQQQVNSKIIQLNKPNSNGNIIVP